MGNEEHVLDEGPPYCAPQTADVAPHSLEQPSNMPKPPPGIFYDGYLSQRRGPMQFEILWVKEWARNRRLRDKVVRKEDPDIPVGSGAGVERRKR